MRPLLRQGKAKPVAWGEIIDPKKFSASAEDFYSKLCVLKFCPLPSVDVISLLFFLFSNFYQPENFLQHWLISTHKIYMSVYLIF